jgi:peptidoglycan/LPS O-acetylase OafA/YrhL
MKLGSIQFLRAIAAILVLYAHSIDLQMGYSHSFQQDFFYWQNFGAFGVDIFFVISSFIISYSAGSYKGVREVGGLIFYRLVETPLLQLMRKRPAR